MQLEKLGSELILESAGYGDGATDPDITVLTNGNILVVWTEVLGQPSDEFNDTDGGIFARVLDADGVPVTDIVQVNASSTFPQDRPHAVAIEGGGFVVGWTSTATFGDHPLDTDTFLRYFDATAQPFNDFLIDVFEDTAPTVSNDKLQEMVSLSDSRFAVILQEPGTNSVNAYVYTSGGSLSTVLNGPIDDMVQLANGNIVRAGVNPDQVGHFDVTLTLTDSTFRAPTGIEGVYDPLTFSLHGVATRNKAVDNIELAALAGGGFAIAYVERLDDDSSRIRLSLLSDEMVLEFDRTPVTRDFTFDSTKGEFDMISLSGGGLAMAVTRPDASGTTLGVDIMLFDADGSLQTKLQAGTSDAGTQSNPSLVELGDGTVALAFTDESGSGGAADYNTMRLVQFDVTGGQGKFTGSAGDDILKGVAGNDIILGLAGDDDIEGRAGDDRLKGGEGNDVISGGKGNDTLRGNEDRDVLKGDAGRDGLGGGDGNDRVFGGAGMTRIAFCGAGQTSWQILQPVQTIGSTRGMPRSRMIAPGSGHRSAQTEHERLRYARH